VGAQDAVPAEVRLYDRLFSEAHPGTGETDFLTQLNPDSIKTIAAFVEPSLAAGGAIAAQAGQQFQFERHGYFVADRTDHTVAKPVFNLAVGLKDSWGK
jgi:glutaminyl-tRNA synthetase